jgi:MFS family permease
MAGAWRVLLTAMVVQCGISILDQGLPTLIGFVKADTGASATAATLLLSTFLLGRCLGSYRAGIAADTIGERPVLVVGAIVTGGLIVLGSAMPLAGLFVALFLAGIASAVATPAGGRLVLTAFARSRQGFALGLRQTAVPLGGLLAAALLPWVAGEWSWRWSLAIAGAITALSALPLAAAKVPRPQRSATNVPRSRYRPAHDRTIRLLTLWGSMFVSAQYALVAFLALDVEDRMALSLATASLFVAIAQAAGIVGRVGWGALSDHLLAWGRKPFLLLLTGVGIAGVAALWAIPSSAPLPVLAVVVAVAGLGVIGFQGMFITMIADAAGPAHVGAATGFAVTFVQMTLVVSIPLYGLVADHLGYHAVWGALTCVLAVAALPAVLVREQEPGI